MSSLSKALLIAFLLIISAAAYALLPPEAAPAMNADKVLVLKGQRQMLLLKNGVVLRDTEFL